MNSHRLALPNLHGTIRAPARLAPIAVFILLLCASLVVRLGWLEADAATTLSWSGAVFTDEGLYSHTPRNAALFGTWRTNEWDDRLVSPLHSGLTYGVFRAFGIGYIQLRMVSVVQSTIALALLWWVLRRDLGERIAALGVALWGLDYFWFQYSRLGLLEPGMVLWLVVAAWSWRRSIDSHHAWATVAGLVAGIAWVWKSLALIFVPAPVLALLLIGASELSAGGGPKRGWIGAWYLAGFGSVMIVYGMVWYLPHRSELAAYNQFYGADRMPESVQELGAALWQNLRSRYIWGQTPVIVGAALVGVVRALHDWRHRKISPTVALSLTWLLCGLALLVMPYSPPRYYTLLLPPLICLACQAVVLTDNHYFNKAAKLAQGVLIIASLVWSGVWYSRWIATRQVTLPETSRALGRLVPRGEVVVGISACGLSLANEIRCVPPIVGLANDGEPASQLGARYALVESNRNDYMRRFHADLLARSQRIQTFPFDGQQVTLYRLAAE